MILHLPNEVMHIIVSRISCQDAFNVVCVSKASTNTLHNLHVAPWRVPLHLLRPILRVMPHLHIFPKLTSAARKTEKITANLLRQSKHLQTPFLRISSTMYTLEAALAHLNLAVPSVVIVHVSTFGGYRYRDVLALQSCTTSLLTRAKTLKRIAYIDRMWSSRPPTTLDISVESVLFVSEHLAHRRNLLQCVRSMSTDVRVLSLHTTRSQRVCDALVRSISQLLPKLCLLTIDGKCYPMTPSRG